MGLPVLDLIVGAVMALAVVRGFFVGMIREGFSVAAIGAVVLGMIYGAQPAGLWIDQATAGEVGGQPAKWIGGAICGVLAGIGVGALGRYLRRGARIVGLGMADRVGGSAIGAAEGALISTLVIVGAMRAFGPEHPAVFNAYSVAVMDEVQFAIETGTVPRLPGLPDVASGPPAERARQARR